MQVPGNPGVWVFLLIELTTFALLFLSYAVLYRLNAALFQEDQRHLNMLWGTVNTVFLLTAGLAMVLATQAQNKMDSARTKHCLLVAGILGFCYIVLKFCEWYTLYSVGVTMSSSTFFGFYYFLSAFHWLHVLLGLIFIAGLFKSYHRNAVNNLHPETLESVASYWHMVDLLWLILFVLLYVL